jgi:hypothetical protein
MMTYYEAFTKDSFGVRKFQAQTDKDDIKFDEEVVRKKQKFFDMETLSIANAAKASKEVRRRAIEKKQRQDVENDDDVVNVQHEIDDTIFAVQVNHMPPIKSTKIWSSRPDHWHAIVGHISSHG